MSRATVSPRRARAESVTRSALQPAWPSGPWTGKLRDRVNLAAHTYVQLLGPRSRFGYGQLPARPVLDSATTDYARPAWIPLPPDSVVVFWTHVWSPTVTLEARLGASGDSLGGYVRATTDVGAKPGQSPGTRMVAQRTVPHRVECAGHLTCVAPVKGAMVAAAAPPHLMKWPCSSVDPLDPAPTVGVGKCFGKLA